MPDADATTQVMLFFRAMAPHSAGAHAALRFAVAQVLGIDPQHVQIVAPFTADDRLSLALPSERALAMLALHTAADPVLDRLQLRDLVLTDGRMLPAYYFAFGPARARNREAIRAISERLLAATGHTTPLRRSQIDAIVDQALGGAPPLTDAGQLDLTGDSLLLLQSTIPAVLRLLTDALLSNELSEGRVLGDETPLMAPALSATELAGLLRDSGIAAGEAQIGALAEAINSAIAVQLMVPRQAIDRQRLASVRVKLMIYFSTEELHNLCFDLGVDFEDLAGATKSGKARELVAFCVRHDRVEPLLAMARHLRPHILW